MKQWIWLVWISKPIDPILLGAKTIHAPSTHHICRIVFTWIRLIQFEVKFMADHRFTPRQRETSLKSNTISHLLDVSLESVLNLANKTRACVKDLCQKLSTWFLKSPVCATKGAVEAISTKSCLNARKIWSSSIGNLFSYSPWFPLFRVSSCPPLRFLGPLLQT